LRISAAGQGTLGFDVTTRAAYIGQFAPGNALSFLEYLGFTRASVSGRMAVV
jgi:hypothetical protein